MVAGMEVVVSNWVVSTESEVVAVVVLSLEVGEVSWSGKGVKGLKLNWDKSNADLEEKG